MRAWVRDDGSVEPEAIKLPECSVDRSNCTTKEASLKRHGDRYVAVAGLLFGELPGDYGETGYSCWVVHCPENGNESHSEIRTLRNSDQTCHKPKSSVTKEMIRRRLASALRVLFEGEKAEPPDQWS